MPCRLSMPKLLPALIFSLGFHAQAAIPVSSIRHPGASLDLSIQNEVCHAERQAALWLCSRQQPDGAWGLTNRFRFTSLALLALAAADKREYSDACSRAILWLDAHATTNRVEDLEPQAWHLIALTRLVPDSPARTNLLTRYSRCAHSALGQATPSARRLWSEALSAAGLANPAPATAEPSDSLARLAETWPGNIPESAADKWRTARLINARPDGQLLRGNTPLDWRRDLAQILIDTQRYEPSGGGYWEAPTSDARIAETAFALLTLLEL